MGEAYLGEVRLFAGNYAPAHWKFCDGQLLDISQYTALFSLLGNNFGGDGRVTFALPDYRGRMNIHPGQVAGQGTNYFLGQWGGVENITLTLNQYPAHTHQLQGHAASPADANSPQNAYPGTATASIYKQGSTSVTLENDTVTNSNGGSGWHTNVQPGLVVNYIICVTTGIYPSWN